MNQQEFCQDCSHKHDCRHIYRQLGHSSCPSVALKVIVAFLLPLVVFIVSLAVFTEIFAAEGRRHLLSSPNGVPANMQELKTVVCFLLALFTALACMFFTKLVNQRLHKVF